MVTRLSIISILDKVCEGCLFRKQPRTTFKSHMHMRTKEVLHVVYSNVCGPFEISSLGKNQYFITFNEYSYTEWLYLIKAKSEVFFYLQKIQYFGGKAK